MTQPEFPPSENRSVPEALADFLISLEDFQAKYFILRAQNRVVHKVFHPEATEEEISAIEKESDARFKQEIINSSDEIRSRLKEIGGLTLPAVLSTGYRTNTRATEWHGFAGPGIHKWSGPDVSEQFHTPTESVLEQLGILAAVKQ